MPFSDCVKLLPVRWPGFAILLWNPVAAGSLLLCNHSNSDTGVNLTLFLTPKSGMVQPLIPLVPRSLISETLPTVLCRRLSAHP
ncbi:hypothetical protein ARMSODRAFT_538272 [Armillaria solidipes]|uniref:Uncharacterized protein n=1 Tax=Armillaria solidipes TaxID=1076256 RepID=A0A2H3B958_9AGAR|nr:hypothetical protein ARMSODRAFT_538272 [Armillaria solidipes]